MCRGLKFTICIYYKYIVTCTMYNKFLFYLKIKIIFAENREQRVILHINVTLHKLSSSLLKCSSVQYRKSLTSFRKNAPILLEELSDVDASNSLICKPVEHPRREIHHQDLGLSSIIHEHGFGPRNGNAN